MINELFRSKEIITVSISFGTSEVDVLLPQAKNKNDKSNNGDSILKSMNLE